MLKKAVAGDGGTVISSIFRIGGPATVGFEPAMVGHMQAMAGLFYQGIAEFFLHPYFDFISAVIDRIGFSLFDIEIQVFTIDNE